MTSPRNQHFRGFAYCATAIASALLITTNAVADPGKGKGKGQNKDKRGDIVELDNRTEARRNYDRLGDRERNIFRDYYGNGDNCPPGLAKKNNGCLPPGIAKKRYEVGHPLGDDVIVSKIPLDLERRLPILPDQYGYRLIDGDLGVVEIATLVVLDAIVAS